MSSPDVSVEYHVGRHGQVLGVMSLETLRRMRERGELTGEEMIWREGMAEWRPLAELFRPPPLPSPVVVRPQRATSPESKAWLGWLIGGGVFVALCLAVAVVWMVRTAHKVLATLPDSAPETWSRPAEPDGIELAGSVLPRPETRTMASRQPEDRAFRERHYLEAYRRDGVPAEADAADEGRFLELWLAVRFGGAGEEIEREWRELGRRLLARTEGRDALVLMTLAINGFHPADTGHADFLEKALAAFDGSRHRPYPRFCLTVNLAAALPRGSGRIADLDTRALALLRDALSGGDISPEEQEILGDSFVGGWADSFFGRNRDRVCSLVDEAGKDWRWLALLLSGERHIDKAWAARGGGYANTVTEEGWNGFREGLENARRDLTAAWRLAPGRPLAPARMIAVAMGQSQARDMRTWFERALDAQIDHRTAWSAMRWALRPRWFGSPEAMLALGVTAVDTGRFDTDAPRQLIDVVLDLENDSKEKSPDRLFGRADIWPQVRRMYEGYLAEPAVAGERDGWRTAYASAAYLAGEYEVARAQLEQLGWRPLPGPLEGWRADLSRMHLEVAARTGAQARQVAEAEALWARDSRELARERYRAILGAAADPRTAEWAKFRAESP